MGAENRVEDMGEEGNRSLGKMLQCPVRDTVRARSLADLETPGGYIIYRRYVALWVVHIKRGEKANGKQVQE